MKWSKLRTVSLLLGLAVIIGATAAEKGIGTYCNVCPVGFMQIAAAGRSIPTGMIAGVLIGLALVFIIGRFFCAWLCPSALLRSKKTKLPTYSQTPRYLRYMPFMILGLALLVSFIVQFPVFCLVCPVGLFFGFIFAIFKLFHVYEPGWNLIIFPAILALEFLILRRWCAYICPMAGVFMLLRKMPLPKLKLKVNQGSCLLSQGKNCHVCANVCPEALEITKDDGAFTERCTTCMECKEHCPTKSIHL